eukprot:6191997-Pleurochrysis_carterae.AAC.4
MGNSSFRCPKSDLALREIVRTNLGGYTRKLGDYGLCGEVAAKEEDLRANWGTWSSYWAVCHKGFEGDEILLDCGILNSTAK